MKKLLSQEIEKAYEHLIHTLRLLDRSKKAIEWNGGKITSNELIAYQIGWGKNLIRWYEAGIKGKNPHIPVEGISKWDYNAISAHFFHTYRYDEGDLQLDVFQETVKKIVAIAKHEEKTGHINRLDVWPWCTLPSGKQ
ncbi:MAG: ClbS/DfsB family four-helix bundle protein, partial [Parachlamydiaceae bacterium]